MSACRSASAETVAARVAILPSYPPQARPWPFSRSYRRNPVSSRGRLVAKPRQTRNGPIGESSIARIKKIAAGGVAKRFCMSLAQTGYRPDRGSLDLTGRQNQLLLQLRSLNL